MLPADWWPDERMLADAVTRFGFAGSELEAYSRKFRLFWRSKGHTVQGKKLDWSDAWWNWLKKEAEPPVTPGGPPTGSPGSRGSRAGSRRSNRAPDHRITDAEMGFTTDRRPSPKG